MFHAFQAIPSISSNAGTTFLTQGTRRATTTFSDSTGPVIRINFKIPGKRGNNYVANLLKLTGVKYRFRLYDSAGNRLNTITEEDATPPANVIENLVASINSNATFKKYIHVTFIKETTEAMSDSVNIGDGQRLRGGQ